MFNYIDRYIDWTLDLNPSWVGFVMFFLFFIAAMVTVCLILVISVVLITVTSGWIILAIPAFLVYAVYLALNQ